MSRPPRPRHMAAPLRGIGLPFAPPKPTLLEQEPQIAALLAPLGRTGFEGKGPRPGKP